MVFTITNTLGNTDTPGGPDDPDNPDDPNNPDDPDNPDNPGDPGNPDNPGDPDNPGTYDDTPKTGDDSGLIPWVLLMIASLMGMAVIFVILVKNNRRNTR